MQFKEILRLLFLLRVLLRKYIYIYLTELWSNHIFKNPAFFQLSYKSGCFIFPNGLLCGTHLSEEWLLPTVTEWFFNIYCTISLLFDKCDIDLIMNYILNNWVEYDLISKKTFVRKIFRGICENTCKQINIWLNRNGDMHTSLLV